MIELPVTIDSGDIWSGWVLIGVSIPAGFGAFLYQLYASEAEKSDTVQMFRYGFEEFRRQVTIDAQKGLEPLLTIVDLNFSAVDVTDPILRPEAIRSITCQNGTSTSHARGDIHRCFSKSGPNSSRSPDPFLIEAKTADRRAISYRVKTGGDPFWFFKREYQNTA